MNAAMSIRDTLRPMGKEIPVERVLRKSVKSRNCPAQKPRMITFATSWMLW